MLLKIQFRKFEKIKFIACNFSSIHDLKCFQVVYGIFHSNAMYECFAAKFTQNAHLSIKLKIGRKNLYKTS